MESPKLHPTPSKRPHSRFGIVAFVIALLTGACELCLLGITITLPIDTFSDDSPVTLGLGILFCSGILVNIGGSLSGFMGIIQSGRKKTFAVLGFIFNSLLAISLILISILPENTFSGCEGLNQAGLTLKDQGQYDEALSKLEHALECGQDVGDFAGEGIALNNIGDVYRLQGHFDEALSRFQEALIIHRLADNLSGESTTLNNIGLVYRVQGRYGEALSRYEQALNISRELDEQDKVGAALINIAEVKGVQGQYIEALTMFEEALVIVRDLDNRYQEGTVLNNIGVIYFSQGRLDEALEMFQRSLLITHEVGNKAGEGETYGNMGLVYLMQGRHDKALENFQEAWRISHEIGNQYGEGIAINSIANAYTQQGLYEEALDAFAQTLNINRALGNRAGEATILINMGQVYELLGRYEEAIENSQNAVTIARDIRDPLIEVNGLNTIGVVFLSIGNYDQALNNFQQARVIDQEIGNPISVGFTLSGIGLAYEQQGNVEDALRSYEQAMAAFDSARGSVGSEMGKTSFFAQITNLYQRTTLLYYQQGHYESAFFTSERGRARGFLDSLSTGYIRLNDDVVLGELYTLEQEAYIARQAAQEILLATHALTSVNSTLVASLEKQLAVAEGTYQEILREMEVQGGQLASLVPGGNSVLTVKEVQAFLDDQTILISFYVLDTQTLVFLIKEDLFEVVKIDVTRQALVNSITGWRDRLEQRQIDPLTQQAIQEAAVYEAQRLHQILIDPLSPHLDVSRLVIIPNGPLHYLPFAGLTDGERYLIEDYTLSFLPSASTLPFVQQRMMQAGVRSDRPLVIGNPTTSNPNMSSLPFAAQEAERIAELFDVQPYTGVTATEGLVWKQAPLATVLHMAAHGRYDSINPLYSSIELAPSEQYDGRLEVHEIYSLDLTNLDLIVLSACQTQLGELSAGDELMGLTRAFFFAGTQNVVATLWNVNDQATASLMEHFYTYMAQGSDKADALRQAQLDAAKEYPDPYFWAGFVLSGLGK
jgi:CHAT domain-containing protein/tetratricopeptide (TPR) repeat protein